MYGVTKEIETQCKEGSFLNLLQKNSGKARLKERIETDGEIRSLLHHEETATLEDIETDGTEMTIMGNVHLRCLYISSNEQTGYGYVEKDLPFIYTLEAGDITGKSISQDIRLSVEQMELTLLDGRQIECNGMISVTAMIWEEKQEPIIIGATVSELDGEKMKNLPGMVIYVVKEGDSLWQIGKEYYIPVDTIKEINGLSKDECRAGDKLLLVKNTTEVQK
jgi:LysM repeat protein